MLACSYHIFIYSFNFNNLDIDNIVEKLKKYHWVETNFEEEFKNTLDKEEYFNKYATYQYFNEQVRYILFHKNDVVKNFELWHNGEKVDNGKYVVKKGNDEIILIIKSIKLKLFSTGSGLIIFDLENYGWTSMEDINKINEYGRRLTLPFIGSGSHPLVSDSIEIFVHGKKIASENFKDTIDKLNTNFLNEKKKFSFSAKSKLISELLPIEHNTSDDRMFVCSLARNNELVDRTCEYSLNEYGYLNDFDNDEENSSSNELYKYTFIETSVTCQNKNMKKRKLEESIYARWADYGTLYGITSFSFVCLTREDEFLKYSVITPFVNQYVEMVCLAIIQRDSIALMLKEILEDALLKNKFLEFQNWLLMSKITMQEQGVELFDLMRKQLDIKSEYEVLEGKLKNIGIL